MEHRISVQGWVRHFLLLQFSEYSQLMSYVASSCGLVRLKLKQYRGVSKSLDWDCYWVF